MLNFRCPVCKKEYKAKDELGGKRANCTNPQCRTMFIIPKLPVEVAPSPPGPWWQPVPPENSAQAQPNSYENTTQAQPAATEKTPFPGHLSYPCPVCGMDNRTRTDGRGKDRKCRNPMCQKVTFVPVPYSREEWDNFAKKCKNEWHGHWWQKVFRAKKLALFLLTVAAVICVFVLIYAPSIVGKITTACYFFCAVTSLLFLYKKHLTHDHQSEDG